jgi:hypothetical protein
MNLLDLPVELVRAVSIRIRDSTSRIRFNSVVPRECRVSLPHDARLSMLEFIARSAGRLRLMSADTLGFLLEHRSPLADAFEGSAHERFGPAEYFDRFAAYGMRHADSATAA